MKGRKQTITYNYPMLFVNNEISNVFIQIFQKNGIGLEPYWGIYINKQEQRVLYLSFHYIWAALAIQIRLKSRSLLTKNHYLTTVIWTISKMKLSLPLRLPNIFNIHSAVGVLKENDIVLSLIKPGEKSSPLYWGTFPSNIKVIPW